jgi:hypothetical protein
VRSQQEMAAEVERARRLAEERLVRVEQLESEHTGEAQAKAAAAAVAEVGPTTLTVRACGHDGAPKKQPPRRGGGGAEGAVETGRAREALPWLISSSLRPPRCAVPRCDASQARAAEELARFRRLHEEDAQVPPAQRHQRPAPPNACFDR